jgi:cobalt/nickel transport system permease protein
MHIPDGYLSPQTYVPLYGITIPLWYYASKKLKKELKEKQIPYLALSSAFSFVIMMFNIPAPGGTTGHAVGAPLIALILGPYAAFLSVSVALTIQALLFGDGGITTLGANCFTMAFVMSFSGFYTYIFFSKFLKPKISAALSGYFSLNLSAFLVAFFLGIQPLIAHTPLGKPLYFPYSLKISITAMGFEHLLIFGFIEATVTAIVFSYFLKNEKEILYVCKK